MRYVDAIFFGKKGCDAISITMRLPSLLASGVARVPCALEQKILLRPHQQKLQSLK